MWLPGPVYESLPYAYIAAGLACLAASWYLMEGFWPPVLLTAGIAVLVLGIVIWLKRRDYRATQSEYNSRSLDD